MCQNHQLTIKILIMKPILHSPSFVTLFLAALSLLAGACYSYKPVLLPAEDLASRQAEMAAAILPNKNYELKLNDGTTIVIQVTKLENDTLFGRMESKSVNGKTLTDAYGNPIKDPNSQIPLETIREIRKRKFSSGKTVIASGAAIALTAGVIAFILSNVNWALY